ncbi:MAG: ABC transporter substrate-binding protein [Firmicutes bacterium]|nr:ABC transporter substrate-binding protein [Bacillota bacterium]
MVAVALLAVFVLLAVGCRKADDKPKGADPAPKTGETGKQGGTTPEPEKKPAKTTMTVLLYGEPDTLDPIYSMGIPEKNILVNVGEGLFTISKNKEIKPVLAESYKVIDELTWEFKLRPGIKFQNVQPLNAAAVKFNYERTQADAGKMNKWAGDINIKSIEVVDELTFRFHTTDPTPHMLARIADDHYMMEPSHVKSKTPEEVARQPIGTGAYKLKEWRAGDRVILEANENYWGGKPTIKEIVFRFIPEEGTRIAELEKGNADIVFKVSPDSIPLVEKIPTAKVLSGMGGRRVYLGIRNTPENLPTAKKEVRQALNYGVNVASIVKNILSDKAVRLLNPILPPNQKPDLPKYEYDPEKAKQLLAQAGYPNGFSVKLDAFLGATLKDREFLQAIVDDYRKIGVEVTLNIMEKAAFGQALKDRKNSELYLHTAGAGFDPALDVRNMRPDHPNNGHQFTPPEFLEGFEKIRTIVDPKLRQEWSYKLQDVMSDGAPWVFLWMEPEVYGVNKGLNGFTPQGDEHLRVFYPITGDIITLE